HPVGGPEGEVAVVGQGLHPIDSGGAAPALLGEGQVDTDRQNPDSLQGSRLFVEATGLLVANAGIQGGNHADDADGTLAVRQRYRLKIVVQHGEIGSGIPQLHLISHQGDRISLESHVSPSFLSHASFPPFQIVLPPFFHLITSRPFFILSQERRERETQAPSPLPIPARFASSRLPSGRRGDLDKSAIRVEKALARRTSCRLKEIRLSSR